MRRTREELRDVMGVPATVVKRAIVELGIESARPMMEEIQEEVAAQCVRILRGMYDEEARKTNPAQKNRLAKLAGMAARAADFRQAVKREIRNRPGVTPWVDWMGRTRLCADNDLLRV